MNKAFINFDPKAASLGLLQGLSPRSRQVIKKRYGLESKEGMTLEAVGQIYGITRERVRQIEVATTKTIKKSEAFAKLSFAFAELKQVMDDFGGIVHEQLFLDHISPDRIIQNNIHFLLVLGDAFTKLKEDDSFHHRWTIDVELAHAVHQSIKKLCEGLSEKDLLSEEKILDNFLANLEKGIGVEKARNKFRQWMSLSKEIGLSPIGEWGLARSPSVRVRGIRDYAFLVFRQSGKPMHFTEVAKAISEKFSRKTNDATCHNELIKDARFVLVGRGIYALRDWGYTPGVVRDVIQSILEKRGPLTKAEVVAEVTKQRYVKPNTIIINLKNRQFFKEDKSGHFMPV